VAAGTITDYNLVTELVDGYVGPVLTANLSLMRSGVITGTHDGISFPISQGNTWTVRGYQQETSDWDTPVAATDMDVNFSGTYQDVGCILRRGYALGVEDVSRFAGGDPENAYASYLANQIGHHAGRNIERTFFEGVLLGLFNTSGTLRSSHVKVAASGLTVSDVEDGRWLVGENGGSYDFIMMHSTVYKNYSKNELVNYSDTARAMYQEMGLQYGGRIGGQDILLNDRVYSSGNTYHTYLMKRGALFLGFQRDLNIEYDRQILKAGGTDVWKYTAYFSPHVPGTSFTGTAPTGVGGATDANLYTVGNWTKRTGIDNSQIGIVAIESTEA
jgi:hypothetical protein